ncbi:MAG: hypothetical protein GF320_21885 [Armatimonadia bacterium]|nr:hypothetical protein [Armatimonadia bacterium]
MHPEQEFDRVWRRRARRDRLTVQVHGDAAVRERFRAAMDAAGCRVIDQYACERRSEWLCVSVPMEEVECDG